MDSIFPPNPKEGDRLEIASKGLIYRAEQWNLEVLIPLLTNTDSEIPNPPTTETGMLPQDDSSH